MYPALKKAKFTISEILLKITSKERSKKVKFIVRRKINRVKLLQNQYRRQIIRQGDRQ